MNLDNELDLELMKEMTVKPCCDILDAGSAFIWASECHFQDAVSEQETVP